MTDKTDAAKIAHDRYVGDDPERQESVEQGRINAHVAWMIYTYRMKAHMTQAELADAIGTKQSVISRLEDADYDGHSLLMLKRIADALNCTLTIGMIPR